VNQYCLECGCWLKLYDHYECRNCRNIYSREHVIQADDPMVAHGIRCDTCEGTGTEEQTFEEAHPYGDTVAYEMLVEFVDCEECSGKGYFPDENKKACVICGRDIPDGTGVLVNGWRVHEDFACSTDEPPHLDGWDG